MLSHRRSPLAIIEPCGHWPTGPPLFRSRRIAPALLKGCYIVDSSSADIFFPRPQSLPSSSSSFFRPTSSVGDFNRHSLTFLPATIAASFRTSSSTSVLIPFGGYRSTIDLRQSNLAAGVLISSGQAPLSIPSIHIRSGSHCSCFCSSVATTEICDHRQIWCEDLIIKAELELSAPANTLSSGQVIPCYGTVPDSWSHFRHSERVWIGVGAAIKELWLFGIRIRDGASYLRIFQIYHV